MSKFEKGQWVRAMVGNQHINVGDVGKVAESGSIAPFVDWIGKGRWAYAQSELEPWQPKVGDRVRMTRVVDDHKADCAATVICTDDGDSQPIAIKFDIAQPWAHTARGQAGDRQAYWVSVEDIEPVTDAAPVEAPAKLKIAAGKFYKTSLGKKVGPMKSSLDRWYVLGELGTWNFDGTASHHHRPTAEDLGHLISEWVDEPVATVANDNSAESRPKFKAGDRVRCLKNADGQFTAGKVYEVAADFFAESRGHVLIKRDDRGSTANGWGPEHFELATPTNPAIVALIEDGQPKPSQRPFVHADEASASKEAARLAGLHKGQKFGVYVLTQTVSEERVYEHEWQRLAASGNKIEAIKAIRALTGFGLKASKDGVEDWLSRYAA